MNRIRISFFVIIGLLLALFNSKQLLTQIRINVLYYHGWHLIQTHATRIQQPYYGAFDIPYFSDIQENGIKQLTGIINPSYQEQYALALIAMATNRNEIAISYLRQLLDQQYRERLPAMLLGEALARSNQYDMAIKIWREFSLESAFIMAAKYHVNSTSDIRYHYFSLATDIDPWNMETYEIWFRFCKRENKWDEILGIAQKSISHGIYDSILYHWAGIAYLELGKPQQAEQQFQIAITINPKDAASYLSLSDLYWSDPTTENQGTDALLQYQQLKPDDPISYALLGRHLLKTGHPEQALTQLLAAHNLGMENADIMERIGRAYYQLEQWTQAIDALQTAIDLQEQELARGIDIPLWRQANAYGYLALAYWQIGESNKAIIYGCRALQLEPQTSSQALFPQELINTCNSKNE